MVKLKSPYELSNLEVTEMEAPGEPGPGEILVRIYSSSLNFHDYAVAIGALPTQPGRIPLSDGAGIVTALGSGVSEFKVGDSVVSCFAPSWQYGTPTISDFSQTPGDGVDGYALEAVIRPANWFTRVPRGYSYAEAATITTAGLTAWRALVVESKVKPGDTVLIQGSGGVSIFALQIAKAMGATVIATSSSYEKLERLKDLGADFTINYKRQTQWARAVLALTDGIGVDHIVEVGGQGTLGQSIQACRIGGHIQLVGVLTGLSGEIALPLLLGRQIRLSGFIVGSRAQQMDFIRAIETTGLRPVIDSQFQLNELGTAFQRQAAGKHFGKIAIAI
ncbi:NAD(P)-dependent alcohol dehydrogenase [Granulicella sp. dw_53]|uniref:zinc-dependent alcohol dehydrogenase family protein n=1 Tax=Granulicella sp. dw_53 TaxID=2719792 RepID=UPI001BD4C9C8